MHELHTILRRNEWRILQSKMFVNFFSLRCPIYKFVFVETPTTLNYDKKDLWVTDFTFSIIGYLILIENKQNCLKTAAIVEENIILKYYSYK